MNDAMTSAQESVWDYPRPPDVVPSDETVEIYLSGHVIARSIHTLRVRETSHPPTYYVPMDDFVAGALTPVAGTTYCEFKGVAQYFDILAEPTASDREAPIVVAPRAAWHYPKASGRFAQLLGYVAVMPSAVDRCVVNGEIVVPQEGSFYGGWITSRVKGPFKGAPGTLGW